MTECRFYDFFLLVSQVLHTYGRGSAYVELDDWSGVPCDDCGDSVDEDDRYYCHRCDATLCGSCSASCQGCGDSYCSGCLSRVPPAATIIAPPAWRRARCAASDSARTAARTGLCRSCHEKQRNEEHEDDPSENLANEPVAAGA